MKKYIISVASVATLFFSAQEKEKKIEGVTIVKTEKEQEQKIFLQNGRPTEILTKKELNRNNTVLIEQTLNTIAGVQVEKRTNIGGQKIVLRGYGNDQKFNNWGVKMYLNGVPLTNADGVTILEDVDFSQVNYVEVVKGPASTKFGGGIGGVVQFEMRPSKQKGTVLSEKLTLGSFRHIQSETNVSSVTDRSSVAFSYNHVESDGFRPRGKSLKNNYAFLGKFKLNKQQDIEVYTAHNNSYEQVSGQISYEDYYAGKDPGNSSYIDRGSGNKFVSNRASIKHRWQMIKGLNNDTSIFFSHLDTKRIAAGAYEKSGNINYGLRSVFTLDKKIDEYFKSKSELGVEYMTSKSLISNYRFTKSATQPLQVKPIKKASYFDNENQNYSIFAIEKMTYQPWGMSLIVGVSANKTKYNREDLLALDGLIDGYDKNLSFSKNFKMSFTPHIALQKKWKKQTFNLSYSEGYNSPTSKSTLGNADSPNEVNDNLQVEKAKMWDFSMQGLFLNKSLDYQLSFFSMNIEDKLTLVKTPDYKYFVNGGVQHNQGLEASLGYVSPDYAFIDYVRPFASYSYYDFTYDTLEVKGKKYGGKQVVGVPVHKYAIGLDIQTKFGGYMNNTFQYLGEVYSDFGNTNLVKGFGLYNAKIGYQKRIGKLDVDVFLAGNNLTNQIHYTFLFSGNNQKNGDDNSNYANVQTDINPGPSKAYYFYGLNLKYQF